MEERKELGLILIENEFEHALGQVCWYVSGRKKVDVMAIVQVFWQSRFYASRIFNGDHVIAFLTYWSTELTDEVSIFHQYMQIYSTIPSMAHGWSSSLNTSQSASATLYAGDYLHISALWSVWDVSAVYSSRELFVLAPNGAIPSKGMIVPGHRTRKRHLRTPIRVGVWYVWKIRDFTLSIAATDRPANCPCANTINGVRTGRRPTRDHRRFRKIAALA